MDEVNFNHVLLVSAEWGLVIPLKLENDWTVSPGIKPNVNTAIIPYTSWDLIANIENFYLRSVKWDVRFFFKDSPYNPDTGRLIDPSSDAGDVVLRQHYLIDVEAMTIGMPVDAPVTTRRVVEYRVYIADRRQQFFSPRGGAMFDGEINKVPAVLLPKEKGGGVVDQNGQPLLTRQQCIRRCLKAMGIDQETIVPQGFSDYPAPANLKWMGNHAPTEFAKMVEEADHAIALQPDGKLKIVKVNDVNAAPPTIPPELALPVLKVPHFDRRGATVIITSAPSPIINNVELKGPSEDTWSFVIRDVTQVWEKPEVTQFFIRSWLETPQDAMRNGCENVEKNSSFTTMGLKEQVKTDLFRCIRLNADNYGPTPFVTSVYAAPDPGQSSAESGLVLAKPVSDPYVIGKLATQDRDRCWRNAAYNTIRISEILDNGKVLIAATPLGSVDKDAAIDIRDGFVKPDDNSLTLRVSFEAWKQVEGDDPNAGVQWQPEFFKVGFTQDVGGIRKLTTEEFNTALYDPETLLLSHPELIQFRKNGEDVNLAKLEQQAETIAERLIKDSGNPPEVWEAIGFVKAELSGKVSEIKYSQEKLLTTLTLYGWHKPTMRYGEQKTEDEGKAPGKGKGGTGISATSGGAYAGQAAIEPNRTAMGLTGSQRPLTTVTPPPFTPAVDTCVLVRITDKITARGYKGVVLMGRATAPTFAIAADPIAKIIDGPKCFVVNAAEPDVSKPTHFLPLGEIYVGKVIGSNDDGPIVEVDCLRCGASDNLKIGKADTSTVAEDDTNVEGAQSKEMFLNVLTRIASDDSAVWGYFRQLRVACGRITDVTGENKVLIANLGDCS